MADTTARTLNLLNLLQTHRHWGGPELAVRLGVSERTLRRDVERLRELGYRVESVPGADGGYRLEAGSAVPPLLLTDEEAVTMAIGLRVAATQRLVDGPHTTLAALGKLEQVLPAHLRRRVSALAEFVQPAGPDAPPVSPDVVGELALACRDHERIRFGYTAAGGEASKRHAEPYTLVPAEGRWYLLAWDLERDDWRTFRVDRLDGLFHTRARFDPRPLPPGGAAQFVAAAALSGPQPLEGRAVIDLGLDQVRAAFGPWAEGAEEMPDGRTSWPMGGASIQDVLFGLSWIPAGVDYEVRLPAPARAELAEIAARLLRATSGPAG
ncbi:helix-turn-helix transcriptional regulator [Zafaria sp. Z1313]|uniref:helix-turn-helix transcriptional regulator n=1 Tax=unclassified Zafaria TaxID=2828765 RepID=UPI002E79B5BC|nr:WYL domain-containing protein [Zafaria sp. J156]MEE1621305.1 WYL domain-containing protein [Zafaria sp. J156]